MANVVSFDDLPASKTAYRFEGNGHGSSISVFVSHHPPGEFVPLHRHPYEETFICLEGETTFSVDGEKVTASPGHIVIVPAGAAHGFENTGDVPLKQVSVHPAPVMEQEWIRDGG